MTISPELQKHLEAMPPALFEELRLFLTGCLKNCDDSHERRVKLYCEFYEPFQVDDVEEERRAQQAATSRSHELPVLPLVEHMNSRA